MDEVPLRHVGGAGEGAEGGDTEARVAGSAAGSGDGLARMLW